MRFTLTPKQKKHLAQIAQDYHLRFIILHGSYAEGKPRKGSDLDIAFLGKHPIAFDDIFKLHGKLADVFGDSPSRELDPKALDDVDSLFRYEVVRTGVLLYGDPTEYDEFRAYAFRDYMDSRDLRRLQTTLLQKSIRSLAERYNSKKRHGVKT